MCIIVIIVYNQWKKRWNDSAVVFLEISAVLLIGVFCHVICSYALHNALFNQCALSFPPAGELQDTVNILNRSHRLLELQCQVTVCSTTNTVLCLFATQNYGPALLCLCWYRIYGLARLPVAIVGLAVSVGILT